MAYGIQVRNNRGSIIVDQETPVVCVGGSFTNNLSGGSRPTFDLFNRLEGNPYSAFQVASHFNRVDIYGTYLGFGSNSFPFRVQINDGNTGNLPFDAINLSKYLPKSTGGYGLEVRDETGKVIYRYDDRILAVNQVIFAKQDDEIVIPNGHWFCPVLVNDKSNDRFPFNPFISRVGNTTTWKVDRINKGTIAPQPWSFAALIYNK